MSHTTGPWSLETLRTSSGICHKIGPFPPQRKEGDYRHACLYADHPSNYNPADKELFANAVLIAASPDLLAALEAAVSQYGKPGGPWNVPSDPGGWLDKAQRAIAKAKGNP